jgi:hypothetical protein
MIPSASRHVNLTNFVGDGDIFLFTFIKIYIKNEKLIKNENFKMFNEEPIFELVPSFTYLENNKYFPTQQLFNKEKKIKLNVSQSCIKQSTKQSIKYPFQ